MPEFAFDARLNAVIRVRAPRLEDARKRADEVLDAYDLSPFFLDGFNDAHGDGVRITEVSLGEDPAQMELFEIDGVEVIDA